MLLATAVNDALQHYGGVGLGSGPRGGKKEGDSKGDEEEPGFTSVSSGDAQKQAEQDLMGMKKELEEKSRSEAVVRYDLLPCLNLVAMCSSSNESKKLIRESIFAGIETAKSLKIAVVCSPPVARTDISSRGSTDFTVNLLLVTMR